MNHIMYYYWSNIIWWIGHILHVLSSYLSFPFSSYISFSDYIYFDILIWNIIIRSSINVYSLSIYNKRLLFWNVHGISRLKVTKEDTVQSYQCRNLCVLVAMNEVEFLPINHVSDLFRNSIKSLMSEGSDFPEWKECNALNVIRVLITHGVHRINTITIVGTFFQNVYNFQWKHNQ